MRLKFRVHAHTPSLVNNTSALDNIDRQTPMHYCTVNSSVHNHDATVDSTIHSNSTARRNTVIRLDDRQYQKGDADGCLS